MSSLLSDLGSGPWLMNSWLSTLPAYLPPLLFSLLIITALSVIKGGFPSGVVKNVRALLKSASELRPHRSRLTPRSPAAPVEKGSLAPNVRAPHNLNCPDELSVWQQVDTELGTVQNAHQHFWWSKHSGKALAVLLHAAGNPESVQYRDLKFFANVVSPYLGVSHDVTEGSTPRWPSFMTDDGTPLELSWDWGTKDDSPTIRYSIEPIGLGAGTPLDPGNLIAGPAFQKHLENSLLDMRLEWFQHFRDFFDVRNGTSSFVKDAEDHNTSIFYAFDLSPTHVTAKAYFFPKIRAQVTGQSNLEVLTQAIRAAPYSTSDNLKAWDMFCNFSSEKDGEALEHEMLAIDFIDPLESRIKIYFRCRETTFNSVINVMTIGGRIKNPKIYQGLEDLKRLWNSLFDIDAGTSPGQPLTNVGHRTAGLLYNIEFRLDEEFPVAKIYIPVRHYASSDEAIIQALDIYFKYHQRGKYMPNYVRAMRTLFSRKSMQEKSGIHTYIGCAIRPNGTLRVVSYFKPGISEFEVKSE
ncbi:tryptophan dimethylallyltransferase-domain-containing protein [Xylaria intraflava]|nr:tryptophan dimethylallyltransferase-domain-containing protein [Xylaria intraflava]